jgi:hypothetical protein
MLESETLSTFAEYDVVVCGGGPAGIGAAVMAARGGARTLLIERLGHLGGNAAGAGVINWGDGTGAPVFDELVARLEKAGAAKIRQGDPRPTLDSEGVKAVALQLVMEAGAEVLFLTLSESAWMQGDTVRGVVISNKGGRGLVRARVVVDATADADIAVSAGVEFHKGDPQDGRLQHCSFRYWLEEVDHEKYRREKPTDDELITLFRQAAASGEISVPANLFQPQPGTFPYNQRYRDIWLTNWELEGIDPTDPVAVSRALANCQVAAWKLIEFCRRHLPGYENCRIRKFPDVLGTRESRRIVGQYTLTRDDVLQGRKFPDGIAKVWFYMDLHDSPPGTSIPHTAEFRKANGPPEGDYFEIPYRCLLPQKIRGLLAVGRCISADRDAHGASRLMPTCMWTGAAAGLAAALAVRDNAGLEKVEGARLKEMLAHETGEGLALFNEGEMK